MMGSKSFVFRFADVEVREREFCLVKAGEVLPVEPKAFRVLLFLLNNPQKLIKKDELLDAVWNDTAVSENSLARSASLCYAVCSETTSTSRASSPRYPRWDIAFVCPVEVAEDASGESGLRRLRRTESDETDLPNGLEAEGVVWDTTPETPAPVVDPVVREKELRKQARRRLQKRLIFALPILVVALAAAAWYLLRPLPPPHITTYSQLTHDGHEKLLGGTDGSKIYFTQFQPNSLNQVGVAGGEVAQIPAALPGFFWMLDVSPDGSNLLVTSSESGSDENSLWTVRALGGTSRRIGKSWSATFSPDGNSIAYFIAPGELWLVQSDGTGAHKLASIGGTDLRWSPDGKVMRFSRDGVLWEISADGSHLHEVLPGWQYRGRECCGRWTPDGKFYIFLTTVTAYRGDKIWALDERRRLFRHPSAEPIQLTTGPINWRDPIPGKGMNKIFSDGKTPRGELCRFDQKTKQLQPFLGAISAQDVSFSKDGRSIAYVSYPDGLLWKANRDGSNPVQLSTPPIYAANPRWSPDSSEILFNDIQVNEPNRIYLVSSQDRSPQRLLPDYPGNHNEPGWSADGRRIVFQRQGVDGKGELCILDLANRQVAPVPGSVKLSSPRWSPDGKYIAAISEVQGS